MPGFNTLGAIQVRNRATNFQDTVVRASGESETLNGILQKLFTLGRNATVLSNQLGRHLGVGIDFLLAVKPLELNFPRAQNSLSHNFRRLCRGPRSSLYFTAGTSMWMSMRSSNGPEIFET
jgi:hypothetical protein